MFAALMVHEKLPNSLFLGDVDEFNKIIDELDLRDNIYTKVLSFLRDEGGECVFLVPGNGLIIQKKKILSYRDQRVLVNPKTRVLRGGEQLREWFRIYKDRL